MPNIQQSKIFNNKEEAISYLSGLPLYGNDGKHLIARYWTSGEGSDIASVEGIFHNTNEVRNIEIKDGSGAGSSSAYGNDWNYVVKKRFPIFFTNKYNYYYQGEGIQFELPIIYPGHMAQIIFPVNVFPYRWNPDRNEESIIEFALKGAQRVKTHRSDGGYGRSNLLRDLGLDTEHHWDDPGDNKVFDIWFVSGGELGLGYNVLNIYNHSDHPIYDDFNRNVDFPNATITMSFLDDGGSVKTHNDLIVLGQTDNIKIYNSGWDRTNLDHGVLLQDDLGEGPIDVSDSIAYGHYDEPGLAIQIDFHNKFTIHPDNLITKNTTSPGFRIEAGKIKCYKKSELTPLFTKYRLFDYEGYRSWALPKSLWRAGFRPEHGPIDTFRPRKYERNNIVLYYQPRNIFRCGIDKSTVLKDNLFLWKICSCRNTRIEKEHGLFYFKKETSSHPHRKVEDPNVILFRISYIGIDEDGHYVFNVIKDVSPEGIILDKVGITFIGNDGYRHTASLDVVEIDGIETNVAPPEGDTFKVCCTNLKVKDDKNGNTGMFMLNGEENNNDFSASIRAMYLKFKYDVSITDKKVTYITLDSQYTPIICRELQRRSRRQMRRLNLLKFYWMYGVSNGNGHFTNAFETRYLNTCVYVKKFKGVKSEYPETFYTR